MNGAEPDGHDNGMKENRGSVLIVDVSPTVRKIMRISLERAGYKVVSASDGMQALARLNEAIPDLIFVDIRLPHMDGYQLCKVIKSHGLTKEVPVVMLTGKSGVLDKMKIKMAGASDLITKPFGSADLVGAVEKYAG
jgi:twitching motility two-component system response regulator PilG